MHNTSGLAYTSTLCLGGGRAPWHNLIHIHAFKVFSEIFDHEDKNSGLSVIF